MEASTSGNCTSNKALTKTPSSSVTLCTPGQIYDLLGIALSWFPFSACASYPIFFHPDQQLPHLKGHGLVSIRNFLAHINRALKLTQTHVQDLQCTGNLFFIDTACTSGIFSPADQKKQILPSSHESTHPLRCAQCKGQPICTRHHGGHPLHPAKLIQRTICKTRAPLQCHVGHLALTTPHLWRQAAAFLPSWFLDLTGHRATW